MMGGGFGGPTPPSGLGGGLDIFSLGPTVTTPTIPKQVCPVFKCLVIVVHIRPTLSSCTGLAECQCWQRNGDPRCYISKRWSHLYGYDLL